MATLKQTSPASLRSGPRVAHDNRGSFVPDPRPYLVTIQHRKTNKTVHSYLPLFPHESEDARLTGATRSLYRRLLALNLPGAATRMKPTATATAEVIEAIFVDSKAGPRIA
jgi:hypothetical protein